MDLLGGEERIIWCQDEEKEAKDEKEKEEEIIEITNEELMK